MKSQREPKLFLTATLISECAEIWLALGFAAARKPVDSASVRKEIETLYNTIPSGDGRSGAEIVGPLQIRPSLLYPIIEKLKTAELLLPSENKAKDGRYKEYSMDAEAKTHLMKESDLLIDLLSHLLAVTNELKEQL